MVKCVFLLAVLLFWALKTGNNVPDSPTYTKDTQPIFKNRCSRCHDYMEGKNWQKYEEAFEYRNKIRYRVSTKSMPLGQDMPQEERDLIVKWVDKGAKK